MKVLNFKSSIKNEETFRLWVLVALSFSEIPKITLGSQRANNRNIFQIDIEKGIKFAKTLQQSSISRTSN
jgi:hypothetical protein